MGTMTAPASQPAAPAITQAQAQVPQQPQPQSYQAQQYESQPYSAQAQPAQQLTQSAMPSSSSPQPNYPPTSVQPAQFAPLRPTNLTVSQDNLGLILDVPLQVSVELGKAKKTIKEILELGPGSVIELDRLAGEPVDMIVNGKLVAKCEVVVINETFGIRITDIVQPSERMTSIQ
jgi:flagellar motor switch protein FliN/FliY